MKRSREAVGLFLTSGVGSFGCWKFVDEDREKNKILCARALATDFGISPDLVESILVLMMREAVRQYKKADSSR